MAQGMTATGNLAGRYRLYVRLGCHLCDDAARLLAAAGIDFVRIDVDRDPRLREEYGALLPVLQDTLHDRELVYPFTAASVLAATNLEESDMKHETLSYLAGQVRLDGALYLPAHTAASVPGVVVAPEWWGMTEHVKSAAAKLAEAGYAALVLDLYGAGNTTDQAAQANAWMSALLDNPAELMARAKAGMEALAARPEVDNTRIAAIGFCFGGRVALEMARAGLPLRAAVSFHGGVEAFAPAEKGKVQAALLVEHGEADSMVSLDDVEAFRKEMDAAQVTYHIDIFPGARHAFTNPQADANAVKNGVDLGYDPQAAAQSWQNMLDWLNKYL